MLDKSTHCKYAVNVAAHLLRRQGLPIWDDFPSKSRIRCWNITSHLRLLRTLPALKKSFLRTVATDIGLFFGKEEISNSYACHIAQDAFVTN